MCKIKDIWIIWGGFIAEPPVDFSAFHRTHSCSHHTQQVFLTHTALQAMSKYWLLLYWCAEWPGHVNKVSILGPAPSNETAITQGYRNQSSNHIRSKNKFLLSDPECSWLPLIYARKSFVDSGQIRGILTTWYKQSICKLFNKKQETSVPPGNRILYGNHGNFKWICIPKKKKHVNIR